MGENIYFFISIHQYIICYVSVPERFVIVIVSKKENNGTYCKIKSEIL